MTRINLRDYYPDQYRSDCFIEVTNEVATVFTVSKREEAAYQRRRYYNQILSRPE